MAKDKKLAEATKKTVARVTREQTFTEINRLAAFRMAEDGEIVPK